MQEFERETIKVIGIEKSQKKCAACGETKPISEFSRHPKAKDGYNSACKVCRGTAAKSDKPVQRMNPVEVTAQSILAEAAEIRAGSRAVDYGDAVESFRQVADIATMMSGRRIEPDECCMVLMAVKIARERHSHKRDNLVDLCGYADILQLIRESEV